MVTDGRGGVGLEIDTLRLTSDADEVTHLVCCRDERWGTAFCGFESDTLNMAAEHACSMCVAEVERLMPDFFEYSPPHCPKDREPCPSQFEVDLRVTGVFWRAVPPRSAVRR